MSLVCKEGPTAASPPARAGKVGSRRGHVCHGAGGCEPGSRELARRPGGKGLSGFPCLDRCPTPGTRLIFKKALQSVGQKEFQRGWPLFMFSHLEAFSLELLARR